MTPETFVFVLVLLAVKYTLEFADRRRWREKRRRRRRVSGFPAKPSRPPPAPAEPPSEKTSAEAAATGDPFWDMVNARIAALPPEEEPLK